MLVANQSLICYTINIIQNYMLELQLKKCEYSEVLEILRQPKLVDELTPTIKTHNE